MKKTVFLTGAACALAACAPMGKQSPLAEPVRPPLAAGETAPVRAAWWQALGDETLNRLVEQALSRSADLDGAAARLSRVQAQLGILDAADGAQIGLNIAGYGIASADKPNVSAVNPYLHGSRYLGVADALLQASWSPDFWGKNRARLAAATGQGQAVEWEAAHIRVQTAAAVTAQYLALAALVRQQDLLRERQNNVRERETLIRQRIRAGLLPEAAAYPLQTALLQLDGEALKLRLEAQKLRHALAVTTGQTPDALDGLQPRGNWQTPVLPVDGLRADVLGKRADIAAQRALIESAGAQIQAAKAEFYPNIELKLLAGLSRIDAFDLVKNSGKMLGVLPALTLPLFTSGALQSNLAEKNAQYNEQVAQYDKTVRQAMAAAADAAYAYRNGREHYALAQKSLAVVRKQSAAALRRVAAGLDNRLSYLEKRDAERQQEMAAADSLFRSLAAWNRLHAELGGGIVR